MGRRSTKTTKAGKFMNPTDQFRKEQRRKELKKNKKQRQLVREAVLRMKDVGQMLKEIEEIEQQELENMGHTQHNEKGLEEKKSKLHASIHRVSRYYQQEDPKKAQELKLMIMESEQRRREMSKVYNSYTAARSQYSIEDIPMPDSMEGGLSDIPMPAASGPSEEHKKVLCSIVVPPPPPGPPPPDLMEYEVIEGSAKSVRFADQTKPSIDDAVSDKEKLEDEADDGKEEQGGGEEDEEEVREEDKIEKKEEGEEAILKNVEQGDENDKNTEDPPGPHPTSLQRLPPPAPPGPPPLFRQTFPTRFGIPPGPPPGAPPSGLPLRFGAPPRPLMPPIHSGAVLSAPPTRIHSATKSVSAVISAQPQLRNMTAEVTKFMPTSLRVRRDQPKATKPKLKLNQEVTQQQSTGQIVGTGGGRVHVQGDAYDTFMHEMQGLL